MISLLNFNFDLVKLQIVFWRTREKTDSNTHFAVHVFWITITSTYNFQSIGFIWKSWVRFPVGFSKKECHIPNFWRSPNTRPYECISLVRVLCRFSDLVWNTKWVLKHRVFNLLCNNSMVIIVVSHAVCLDGAEVSALGLKIGRSSVQIPSKTDFSIMIKLPVKSTQICVCDGLKLKFKFKSHPRLTSQSWSSYQLNQLKGGAPAASDFGTF